MEIREQTKKAKKKKLAPGTWDIDIGDLFSEDMCLYNNLSRVQPKVDSSYKFMYDYFKLLKFIKEIHVNN